jgi:hypothetical protein
MADFFAERINVGIPSLPQFQVVIVVSNCGVTKEGWRKVVPSCATVAELDEEVDRAIARLNKAREIARGILEENR